MIFQAFFLPLKTYWKHQDISLVKIFVLDRSGAYIGIENQLRKYLLSGITFHLETMDSIEQFEANEESLAEEKRFKLYVSSPKSIRLQYNPISNCNTIYCDWSIQFLYPYYTRFFIRFIKIQAEGWLILFKHIQAHCITKC